MPHPVFKYQPPEFVHLDILYEDQYCIAVNKPSGLLSVPGRGEDKKDCMLSRLHLSHPGALVVHRLDMSTSGILLFALTKEFQSKMSKLFEQKKVHKSYIAKVYGKLKSKEGSINQPLICDWRNRPKQKIDYSHGKPSTTRYKRLDITADGNSVVELYPITGRSHQLRVHMSSIGHPVLGDVFYSIPDSYKASSRLLLHSHNLSFSHPLDNSLVDIQCKADFL